MRSRGGVPGAALVGVLALAVTGIDAGGHGKCSMPAQECAAHMKEMHRSRGWMGVELEQNEDGILKVTVVVPGSPAEKAGLKAGDILVAVSGVTLSKDTTEKVMRGEGWKIDSTVSLGVKRGPDVTTVKVTLEKIPESLLAGMIEKHTKEAHEITGN